MIFNLGGRPSISLPPPYKKVCDVSNLAVGPRPRRFLPSFGPRPRRSLVINSILYSRPKKMPAKILPAFPLGLVCDDQGLCNGAGKMPAKNLRAFPAPGRAGRGGVFEKMAFWNEPPSEDVCLERTPQTNGYTSAVAYVFPVIDRRRGILLAPVCMDLCLCQ